MDVGNKYIIPSKEQEDKVTLLEMFQMGMFLYWIYFQPFRNSSLVKAEPKSIHGGGEVGNKYLVPDKVAEAKVTWQGVFG